jgi:hypothetical protein
MGDTFSRLLAYSGGVMSKSGWKGIFNLKGITAKNDSVMILREHDRSRIVGYGNIFVDGQGLNVKAKFSCATPDGKEIAALVKENIVPLECSVGIIPEKKHLSQKDEIVNQRKLPAGIEVWDMSTVGEVSVVSWGVDRNTNVRQFSMTKKGIFVMGTMNPQGGVGVNPGTTKEYDTQEPQPDRLVEIDGIISEKAYIEGMLGLNPFLGGEEKKRKIAALKSKYAALVEMLKNKGVK